MQNQKRNLTLQGMTVPHVLFLICTIGMISSSIYLLAHYFQTFYPVGLNEGQLCQSQGFISCDSVAYSPISAIFGIPISIFGILAGAFLFISSIFPSTKLEATNNIFTRVNAVGCIILALYSIFGLGHLCPGCSVYYVFSLLAAWFYFKHSELFNIDIKVSVIYVVITAVACSIVLYSFNAREDIQLRYKKPVLNQFYSFTDFGDPQYESKYRNLSSTEKFSDAPLRISVFSDFQCPYCQQLAKTLLRLNARYAGKLNIQFFFVPLDMSCNPNMKSPMHLLACKASYISACVPEQFAEVHDEIFGMGRGLTNQWLNERAKDLKVTDCMITPKVKKIVLNHLEVASKFEIESTPTMIINGKKVQGALSSTQLYIILDDLLEKSTKAL
ncbi:MAG: thioredoxin domain-containing protein [Bacteriovoracaceae bacterium]|nr:thioredoxin domain-containing protein [Bacteriovoracaceae bacterium]